MSRRQDLDLHDALVLVETVHANLVPHQNVGMPAPVHAGLLDVRVEAGEVVVAAEKKGSVDRKRFRVNL